VPSFLQPHLTVDPEVAGGLVPSIPDASRPLPPLRDPDPMPAVVEPSPEPLVALRHPRITTVEAYRAAGWSSALPGTWVRRSVLDRLVAVVDDLPDPWGLHVFDAWRPLTLQAELFDAAYGDPGLPEGYISEPLADPTTPPPHLTGGTVDVTLSFAGRPLALGTGFDDFTAAAATDHHEMTPGPVRDLRRGLYWAMRRGGFVVLHCEWWHFEFGTRRWAGLTGGRASFGPATLPVESA
jgi:D-alanyl-D-alanine dipeptidase